jgi:queuine tRNA-ribosyltransferase
MTVTFTLDATDGAARAGTAVTASGRSFRTPAFMPVGTRGVVRALDTADLEQMNVEILLANTYHLMLRPGVDAVAALGGLHAFTDWRGAMLTDSGGFQVFSLPAGAVKVDDEGVTFKSTYDGSRHRLTPELAVEVQAQLGADIQMVLDVCPALPASDGVVRQAIERTAAWAARAAKVERAAGQSLFGIVQGGIDVDLRVESAQRTVAIGFDGYGVGGLSVGETREEMSPALTAALGELPSDRLRYLMGVGDPARLVDAVALGIDMFDCVLPTRHGRHGTVLTDGGRLNLRNAQFRLDPGPLDAACPCPVCARWSRSYLRHLLSVQEPTGARLVTLHNLAWLVRFVASMRDAIVQGRFQAFRDATLAIWS